MYISKIIITGFRCFKNTTINLHDGVNIVIGSNNSGKSNLIKAIALVLNVQHYVDIDDLFKESDITLLKEESPRINITLLITQSKNESDISEEAGLLGNYMNQLPSPYEAQLNFLYSLSADQEENYLADVRGIDNQHDIWTILKRHYSRFYELYRWGGNGPASKGKMNDLFDRCDFQFLDALRDVNKGMLTGYNPLLKEVLNFFIDYEVKTDSNKTDDEIKEELHQKQINFKVQSEPLMSILETRLNYGKNIMLDYANETGASFGNVKPDFSGELSESELFAVLRLVIKHETGIEIPATNNGLGYNNLIYMSLLLAKMQASSNLQYMQRQAKLYSLLAIEEPEAHLHPAMQYQFLNFLKKNRDQHNVNQIIVTTHSTQIVSAVDISELICMHSESYGIIRAGYPRKIFSNDTSDKISKAYIQRFLDATRSDMFFADKLIFVEGVAEELLIPTFAHYIGIDLTEKHTLIVNMGGRYFDHFIKLFQGNNEFCLSKKVACITDIDPCCDGEACYPYEYNTNPYNTYTHNGDDKIMDYSNHPNIRYFRQDSMYGKTLEYDIAFYNSKCKMIVVNGMKNEQELKSLMDAETLENMKSSLRESEVNNRIKNSLNNNTTWNDEDKMKALIASRYLNSISKGGNALALSLALEENLHKADGDCTKEEFVVPQYIIDALTWLFQ